MSVQLVRMPACLPACLPRMLTCGGGRVGVGAKTRLESRLKRLKPPSVYDTRYSQGYVDIRHADHVLTITPHTCWPCADYDITHTWVW